MQAMAAKAGALSGAVPRAKRVPRSRGGRKPFAETRAHAGVEIVEPHKGSGSPGQVDGLEQGDAINGNEANTRKKKVYMETYGCQMNVNDSQVVESVLQSNGYEREEEPGEADVILLNTCAIREKAEHRIWQRLAYFRSLRNGASTKAVKEGRAPVVGAPQRLSHSLYPKALTSRCEQVFLGAWRSGSSRSSWRRTGWRTWWRAPTHTGICRNS